jgi:hypothetical protein
MRSLLFAVTGAAVLAACASSSHTYAPDGRPAYTLNCSGLARTWGACYNKAGEICKSAGYDILAGGAEGGAIVGGGQNGFIGGSTISRSMLIACKNPS